MIKNLELELLDYKFCIYDFLPEKKRENINKFYNSSKNIENLIVETLETINKKLTSSDAWFLQKDLCNRHDQSLYVISLLRFLESKGIIFKIRYNKVKLLVPNFPNMILSPTANVCVNYSVFQEYLLNTNSTFDVCIDAFKYKNFGESELRSILLRTLS